MEVYTIKDGGKDAGKDTKTSEPKDRVFEQAEGELWRSVVQLERTRQ